LTGNTDRYGCMLLLFRRKTMFVPVFMVKLDPDFERRYSSETTAVSPVT